MKQEKLMDAMAYVEDALLESAADSMTEKRKRLYWKPLAAAAACLALIVGLYWYNIELPVPKYENAIFSAQQLADLFPAMDKGTNAYTKVSYPNESMLVLPELPDAECLNVYQYTGAVAKEAELKQLMEDVFPLIEKMYGINIPDSEIETRKDYYVGGNEYEAVIDTKEKHIYASSSHRYQGVSWRNKDLSALPINGVTLQAHSTQTDEEIMASVAMVLPYLEQTFDMELSAYKIVRSYSDNDLLGLYIYLYSDEQVTDPLLEQYGGEVKRYCDGDILCLEFDKIDRNSTSDGVVCRWIKYIRSVQQRHEIYAQCRRISLGEAEVLLADGYVFSNHSCKLCMAAQESVDFTDYDRVSLEYVFDYDDINGYGIPFYTFYKKIREDEDGSVQYAKTMVPAIEVSGLEEYFEAQVENHRQW